VDDLSVYFPFYLLPIFVPIDSNLCLLCLGHVDPAYAPLFDPIKVSCFGQSAKGMPYDDAISMQGREIRHVCMYVMEHEGSIRKSLCE
jgi:hypothetical protein